MERPLPAELGEVIRGYRLDSLVSRGGMACVYRATHTALHRVAAVKILDTKLAKDSEYAARFLAEARIVNEVRHANIVDIFDFVQTESPPRVACIMEFIEGPTLKSLIDRGGLDVFQALNVTHQVLSALSEVHARDVIHRDLKPANLMVVGNLSGDLDEIPSVKILDFGIAKVAEAKAYQTGPGAMLGTPAYMAPEQIGSDPVSAATDIYAVGELIYEMFSGQRTFQGSATEVLKAKLSDDPPELSMPTHVPQPGTLRKIITKCLEIYPSQRPSLAALARAIDRYSQAVLGRKLPGLPKPTSGRSINGGTPAPLNVVSGEAWIASLDDTTLSPPRKRSVITELPQAPVIEAEEPPQTQAAQTEASDSSPESNGAIRRLGRYVLFEEQESVGMTQRFVARAEGAIEICVLKRLLRGLENDPVAAARFQREALLASRLDHPHVAKMLGASVEENTFCIATEFIIGVSLRQLITRLSEGERTLPIRMFGPIFTAVLDGLHSAHEATDAQGRPMRIVHRDLTPQSITIGFAGDVKIRDFGVARASVDDFRTSPGMAVGTLEYMSPEQARSGEIDRRSDLYTIATVMFEVLTGMAYIKAEGVLDTLRMITAGPMTSLRTHQPSLDLELCNVVERGLSRNPEDRWATAAEFNHALKQALGPLGAHSPERVGEYLRSVAQDEEAHAIQLLGKIREIGERLPGSKPPSLSEPATASAGDQEAFSPPEEPEPSVMTMPGTILPPNPSRTASGVPAQVQTLPEPEVSEPAPGPQLQPPLPAPAPVRSNRPARAAALVAIFLVVGTAALWLLRTNEKRAVTKSARKQPVLAKPVVATARPAPEPKVAPPPTPTVKPAPKTKPKVPKPALRTPPKAPPSPRPPPAPPPKAPTKKSNPAASRSMSRLRKMISGLQANPDDTARFDRVVEAIRAELSRFPKNVRVRVQIDLDSAERTYNPKQLRRAVDKMERAQLGF